MSQAITVPPASRFPSVAFDAVEKIGSSGAILTLPGNPVRRHLVGHLAWVGPQQLFWFTAHGDTLEDGHAIEFDEMEDVTNLRICFYRAGELIASLAPIAAAGVEDPDDYLIAWQLWHEVSPRRTALIEACLRRFAGGEDSTTPMAAGPAARSSGAAVAAIAAKPA